MDYTGDWHRLYREQGRVFGEEPQPLARQALTVWAPGSDSPQALDIGSYTGRNALFLARAGFHVRALDPSGPALDDLKQQADTEGLACEGREGFIESYTGSSRLTVLDLGFEASASSAGRGEAGA